MRPTGAQEPGDAAVDGLLAKLSIVPRSPLVVPPRWLRNSGVESPQTEGGLAMQMCSADIDRLGDEIAELSAHLEAATARLLDLIREFDAREGWNTGFRSCAAWLSWRVGLDLGAARERVRVARALGTLPRLAQALARGELSYAKVRALTRVATPETEERLLAVGAPGQRTMSSASCEAGDGWTAKPRPLRTADGTRAARCTCIRATTAWSCSVAASRPRSAPCSCRLWLPRARLCINEPVRRPVMRTRRTFPMKLSPGVRPPSPRVRRRSRAVRGGGRGDGECVRCGGDRSSRRRGRGGRRGA